MSDKTGGKKVQLSSPLLGNGLQALWGTGNRSSSGPPAGLSDKAVFSQELWPVPVAALCEVLAI